VATSSTNDDLRDRSVGELVRQLADETTTLLRKEIELAKAELSQKVETAKDEAATTGTVARTQLADATGRTRADVSERVVELKTSLAESARTSGSNLSNVTKKAKAEVAERGRHTGKAVGVLGAAAALTLVGLGALTAFFILALDGVMPNWAAAIVVAGAYFALAALLFSVGKRGLANAGPLVSSQTVGAFQGAVSGAVTESKETVAAAWPPVSPETIDAVRADLRSVVTRAKEGVREAWAPVPEQTVETLKEDLQWAKTRT
jgi:hypothetical protein